MKPQLSVFNFSVQNQAENTVDIHVDGYIVDSPSLEIMKEYWGDETSISYKSFRDQIPSGTKTINLYVNSGGGHVGDAMAIRDYLAGLEASGITVNREGRGIVASAATYLVMGNNSRLSENCLFMVHEVSGFAYGNVTEVENQARAMRKFNDLIVDFYSKETGLSTTVIGNMMRGETWLNATDAKEKGFVKSIGPKVTLTIKLDEKHWPFTNMAMLNTYNSFITKNDNTMDMKAITDAISNGFNTMLEKLGIKDKTAEETTNAAITEFANSITTSIENALKDVKPAPVDNEAITTLVNTAVAEQLKNVVTPDAMAKAITDAMANSLDKTTFQAEITKLTNSIATKLGGKNSAEDTTEKPVNGKKNKWSGAHEIGK